MYTRAKTNLNHLQVAEEIYEYMRYEYKFLTHKGMQLERCVSTLSKKLQRLPDYKVLCWSQALDELAKNHSDNAPTPTEIIRAIERKSKQLDMVRSERANNPKEDKPFINYEALWMGADDKEKFRFFIDYKFSDVPPYIRYWFGQYNRKHRGWSAYESSLMIGYWKLPFKSAQSGAMALHQYQILDYFRERKHGGFDDVKR